MTCYPLTVFFDGACPICAREIALMKRLDRKRRLTFCDFSLQDYDEKVTGFAPSQLGRVIHAQWADGRVITGVRVFQAMWEAVGLGLLTKLSRVSLLEPLFYRAYAWFARNRLWLTGRAKDCPGSTCAAGLGTKRKELDNLRAHRGSGIAHR
jgi:predicted DCC family thiol-disulfide oxidoreductase YuxK